MIKKYIFGYLLISTSVLTIPLFLLVTASIAKGDYVLVALSVIACMAMLKCLIVGNELILSANA